MCDLIEFTASAEELDPDARRSQSNEASSTRLRASVEGV